ncbi:MAG: FHA domain-containing protein [Acidobacteriota bacterium]
MKVILHIEGPGGRQSVDVADELTIGRTDLARLVLDDPGLSRLNTTFFVDDGELLVADENSLNGTYINGVKLAGPPKRLRNGDEVKIGSSTAIRIAIDDGTDSYSQPEPVEPPVKIEPAKLAVPPAAAAPESNRAVLLLLGAAALLTFVIIVVAVAAYVIVSRNEDKPVNRAGRTPQINSGALIPVRVIDPLGGEDEDDLDDLIASWEVQEEEIKADTVADVSVSSADAEDADLNVTAALLADRQKKAFEERPGEKGIRPAGLDVPKELFGDGVIKQKVKLRDMNAGGYQQPMDFAELAEKRLSRQLVEMPMASQSFYLDVGGSARDTPFTAFSFKDGAAEIAPGSPKYQALAKLAGNFAGQKYDLNNPGDRRQMRMRLLRMFNQRAKPILKELADAYFQKFGRPLRVTSLTRSMDYQIGLNASNPNSFKVRGEGSLPPHTSGCAFDLARKHMPADEQNFVMKKLAELEAAGKLDALIEYGVNACFHVFIYDDGKPPKM